MATLLSQYLTKQEELQSQIKADSLPMDSLLVLQELNYRISVLKTMQAFCLAAPITTDPGAMGYHYQMVEYYIRLLLAERKFGSKADETQLKKRETAATALNGIFEDCRRRFSSFKVNNQSQYRSCIGDMVNTILPAWVQYRNTYINSEK